MSVGLTSGAEVCESRRAREIERARAAAGEGRCTGRRVRLGARRGDDSPRLDGAGRSEREPRDRLLEIR